MKQKFEKASKRAIEKSLKSFADEGLELTAIQMFFYETEEKRGVALGFSNLSVMDLHRGIDELIDAICEKTGKEKPDVLSYITLTNILKV